LQEAALASQPQEVFQFLFRQRLAEPRREGFPEVLGGSRAIEPRQQEVFLRSECERFACAVVADQVRPFHPERA
jgi:hypothetical protein